MLLAPHVFLLQVLVGLYLDITTSVSRQCLEIPEFDKLSQFKCDIRAMPTNGCQYIRQLLLDVAFTGIVLYLPTGVSTLQCFSYEVPLKRLIHIKTRTSSCSSCVLHLFCKLLNMFTIFRRMCSLHCNKVPSNRPDICWNPCLR